MSSINNDISQLKKIILDTAIRGKLVPQDENDEDAGILLERIKEEKEKLIKEGKIKKDKPLPEIKSEEILFELPKNWRWVRLAELITMIGGLWEGKSDSRIKAKVLRNTNFTKSLTLNFDNVAELDVDVNQFKTRKLEFLDLLLEKSGGGPKQPVGRVVLFLEKNDVYAFSNFINRMRLLSKEQINAFYIYNFLKHFYQIGGTEKFQKNTTNLRNLNITEYISILVPIPPLSEQQRIVAKIESLFKLADEIDSRRISLVGKVKQLKSAILQEAITGKLVPQDENDEDAGILLEKIKAEKEKLIKEGKMKKDKPLPEIKSEEIPFEIPKSWRWVRASDSLIINPRNNIKDELEIGFIPMKNVSENFGSIPEFEVRKWKDVKSGFTHFAENDLCIAKITPCFENSKSGIFYRLPNGYGAGTTELHILRSISGLIDIKYIYLLIKGDYFLKLGKSKMTGSAGQKRIPTDFVKNLLIPLPPLTEQQRIVEKVDELMSYTNQLEQKLNQSKELTSKLNEAILNQTLESKIHI
jgi:type I restriction enzyme S subunit